MASDRSAPPTRRDDGDPPRGEVGWAWHVAAGLLLAIAAVWNTWDWWSQDRMPPGDFAGYAAQVQRVRDALLAHGRVPDWCVACYGGASNFTGNLKEILVFPLALALDPVLATKLAFTILKIVAGLGLYALAVRGFAAPAAGIVAGYALAFGAIANHQIEHLDAVLATALLPPTVWVASELLRRGGWGWALALGALAACQMVNSWVFALSVPLLVAALAGFAPWRARADEAHPWCDRRGLAGGVGRVAAALGVFLVLAASTLAWIAADAPNHRLVPEASAARQRLVYVERSPFLFVNRDNALAPWLASHQPPGFDLPRTDGGRRYLGAVLLAVCAVGLWVGRRDPRRRRWAAAAATLFALQYWLALGPRTLLWEVATSLHWAPGTRDLVRHALLAAAAVLGVAGAGLGLRAIRARASGRWAVRVLVAAALAFAPAASLWNGLALVFPAFEVQRSPGHFFDVAPVWLCLLFAIALVGLGRRLARRRVAHAGIALVGLAVVVDFAPSRRAFALGVPMEPLRRAAEMVASLPGEDGSLRIGLPIAYLPLASWILEQGEGGHAWGWLPWQSGRDWADYYAGALYPTHGPRPDGRGAIEPDAALVRAARIRHLLVPASMPTPAGWRRVTAAGGFALWEGPAVDPLARAFAATLWLEDPARARAPALVSTALRANVLPVSPPRGPQHPSLAALRERARTVVSPGIPAPDRLAPAPPPREVAVHREAPERLALEVDAGETPALVSVAEGYHPWWRAEVDGRPTPVLRANLAMLGVPVGPGRHAISLRFQPPGWVRAAEAASGVGWIALAGVSAGRIVRGRWRGLGREREPR